MLDPDRAAADFSAAVRLAPDDARYYYARAVAHRQRGDREAAVADATAAVELRPGFAAALALRASVRYAAGDYEAALADYEASRDREPDDPATLNSLAWLRATCPADAVRDGAQAVADAVRACELTGHAVAGYLDTLAAAHAEAGEFAPAVRWQEKVVAMTPPDQRDEYEHRLTLYRVGKPFRDTPPPDIPS